MMRHCLSCNHYSTSGMQLDICSQLLHYKTFVNSHTTPTTLSQQSLRIATTVSMYPMLHFSNSPMFQCSNVPILKASIFKGRSAPTSLGVLVISMQTIMMTMAPMPMLIIGTGAYGNGNSNGKSLAMIIMFMKGLVTDGNVNGN